MKIMRSYCSDFLGLIFYLPTIGVLHHLSLDAY